MKKIIYPLSLLLLFGCCLQDHLTAQTAPLKQWDYRYGGSGGDDLQCAQQTVDGGYILGGESQSYIGGDKTQNPVGLYDYWIVKLDENGVKQWDVTLGGYLNDLLLSLQQTSDGGYILGGYSYSGVGGDKTQPNLGDEDYWIVKVDANGVKQWDANFGGDSTDVLRSLQQTSDGGYILCGFTDSGMNGDISQPSQGGRDYWIVKTDASGNKLWDKRFGGSDFDQGNYVQVTADGGFILGGFSASDISGDKSEGNQGYPWTYDYWIVKTDNAGVKEWDKRFGGGSYDYLYNLKQTSDGGYVLGGYSESGIGGDKTQPSWGSQDYWLVKTDENGIKEWDVRYGGSDNDYAIDIRQTDDGGYLFGGYSDSDASGDKSQDNWGVLYTYDYWIVKTDALGTKLWDERFGGTDWDQLTAVFQSADGGYFLAGLSNSPVSGDKTQSSWGSDDYWVVKLACDGAQLYYADEDHDLYGDPNSTLPSCELPKGYVSDSTDCDDTNPNVYPGAPEIPGNGIDDDCDGEVDEIATGVDNLIDDPNDAFYFYPNPTSGAFHIRFNDVEGNLKEITAEIFDSYGRNVFEKTIQPVNGKWVDQILLPENITDGIYLLCIKVSDEYYQKKIIIER